MITALAEFFMKGYNVKKNKRHTINICMTVLLLLLYDTAVLSDMLSDSSLLFLVLSELNYFSPMTN